jgi:low temperature requirement protein LtrA
MLPRDPVQDGRAASPLELFFDLVFTVAVAGSSAGLYAVEATGDLPRALLAYAMVFFTIWWAWVNFTWFASAFDTDDWLYRLTTLVQMAGALVIAAGAGPAMSSLDFDLVTIGYVVLRLAMVAQWCRAAIANPAFRTVAWRWAGGIVIVQILWVARMLWAPEGWGLATFAVLAAVELAIPPLAQLRRHIPWHPHHVAERYGLFTLIVLGESVLASASAVIDATHSARHLAPLATMAALALVLAAALWWVYFARPMHSHLDTLGSAFAFGYFHYVIFGAIGAFSAGVEVMVRATAGEAPFGPPATVGTVAIPVAIFALGVWWLALRATLTGLGNGIVLALIALVAASPWANLGLAPAAAAMVALVILLEVAPGQPRLGRR